MDNKLLAIIACPICKGELTYDRAKQELICRIDHVAYPIRDNIPVLLEEEARSLTGEERE